MGKYIEILRYLKTYGGEKYKMLSKCKSQEEQTYMEKGSEAGKKARQAFGEIVQRVETRCHLIPGKITQWQNSGNFVKYFWCQLKRKEYIDSNISLSLFAETGAEGFRFRASVELALEKATDEDRAAYKKLLDIPLKSDLCYISGGNNEIEFSILDEKDNEVVKAQKYKKIQVSYILDEKDSDDDAACIEKLLNGVSILLEYYDFLFDETEIRSKKSDLWWPSKEEYDPGVSKDQWKDILNNPQIVGPIWGGILAQFYDYGGAATCSQIADKYGGTPMSVSGCITQFAKAIQKFTGCKIYVSDDEGQYWPIIFQGKKASSDVKGNTVWRFQSELKEALDEVDILRFLDKTNNNRIEIPAKEAIEKIKSYIEMKGFSYSDSLVENFFLSLKSKPFVILAGTSGTGKTRLVKLFAEAISAEYKLIPVRPDWSDSSDLLGYTDLNGNFHAGEMLKFVGEAIEHPDVPYILCLDEMNLARVEYYLSDILSVIETRDKKDGHIVSIPLLFGKRTDADTGIEYENPVFPENLYIVGTVNMDETTFPFSKKVLDRANTIEFNYVDLIPDFFDQDETIEKLCLPNDFLITEYLILQTDCRDEMDFVTSVSQELQELNTILQKANAHVGYRVRDEICFYMLNNKKAELLRRDEAFDNEIMQKILPRLQGSSLSVKSVLCDLFKEIAGDFEGYGSSSGNVAKAMSDKVKNGPVRYPRSAEKIAFMVRRFEEDGFTSYWL